MFLLNKCNTKLERCDVIELIERTSTTSECIKAYTEQKSLNKISIKHNKTIFS